MSLQDDQSDLKNAGFTGDEIQKWTSNRGAQLMNAGFSQSEVQEYLGAKDPSQIEIPAAKDAVNPNNALGVMDAIKAGYQSSATGLAIRGKTPDIQATGSEGQMAHYAGLAANIIPDIPEGIIGGLVGSGGGPVTAAGGAVALPTALRSTLIDAYQNGDFKNFDDFWARFKGIMWDTAKGYGIGAAGGAGAAVAAPLGAAAEVGGATVASTVAQHELNLKEINSAADLVPSAQEFFDNALVILGMKGGMEGAGYLRDLYSKTGISPTQVTEDAQSNPSIKQDLASVNPDIPEAYKPLEEEPLAPEPKEPAKPELKLTGDDAEQKILSKISVGESKGKTLPTWDQVYTAVVDKLDPIRQVTDAMKSGDDEEAILNSYKLMRNLPGAMGKATQFLENSTFDYSTLENTGKPLKEILSPFKDDLDGLRAYAASTRALELEGRGIKSGMDMEAAKQVVASGKGEYGQAFKELNDYQTSTLKYLKDSGVLSQESFNAIKAKNSNYVPFYRVMDDEQGVGFQSRNPIKAIKGSERNIIDPIESVIRNTYAYIKMADRNAAVKSFVDQAMRQEDPSQYFESSDIDIKSSKGIDGEVGKLLEKNGASDLPEDAVNVLKAAKQPLPKDTIGYFDDGQYKTIKVDPDLAEAFNGVPKQAHGMLFNMLRFPAKMLRLGLVTPEFIIRHLERNQLSASVLAEKGNIPFYDTFGGLWDYLGKSEDYQDWLKSGGQVYAPSGIDRDAMQDEISKLTGQGSETLGGRVWNLAKTPFDVLHSIQQSLEAATRIGAYKRAMNGLDVSKDNMVDSAYYSRNIAPDPSRIGSQTGTWNAITALFNTEIQHTDQLVNALKNRPLPTLAKLFAGITLPSVLLWVANHNTEEWKEAHQWERDMFWLVPMGGTTLRIPKPFLTGELFGSGIERILDKISGNDKDNRGLEHFASDLVEWGAPNVIPTAIAPILEQITNYSFFKGANLVPDHLMQELPEYRYSQYTSELTKALGHVVGYVPYAADKSISSPIVLDNYIYKWTGGLGVYSLSLADTALRKSGVLPDPPLPASTLADIPIIKGFVVRYPSATADSIQKFQEDFHKRSEYFNTVQALMKQGDPEGAIRVMQSNPAAMAKLDNVNTTLTQQNTLVRLLYKNPDIKPEEKRQLIDSIYFNMIGIAKQGNQMMDELDKSILPQTVH